MSGLLAAFPWPDRPVRLVLATRILALIGAPVTLFLVATRLAPAEQGLYFIFVNFQALDQLFEVGVGSLIVQYASHECPRLRWGRGGALEGDANALVRVRMLVGRAVRWYTMAGLLLALLALPLGLALFGARTEGNLSSVATWWIVTVLATAAYLPLIPLLTTVEGCGRLVHVQRMRLLQAGAIAACAWTLIPTVGGLAAVAALAIVQLVMAASWLAWRYPALVALGWNATLRPGTTTRTNTPIDRVNATQTRTAASWLAAHVTGQALTVLVLYYRGADIAGQMGMTLAIMMVPFTLGMAWLQGRFPEYGALLSREEWRSLSEVARRATLHATVVCILGLLGVVLAIQVLAIFAPDLRARILPSAAVGALSVVMVVFLLLQAMAGYLRAYRAEPLLAALLCGYASMIGFGWLAAARWGAVAAAVAYALSSALIALPLAAITIRRRLAALSAARERVA